MVEKVVFVHNCNNRNVEPTTYDTQLVAVLKTVLSLFGAIVEDYILTNGTVFYSFKQHNLIDKAPLLFDGQEIHLK